MSSFRLKRKMYIGDTEAGKQLIRQLNKRLWNRAERENYVKSIKAISSAAEERHRLNKIAIRKAEEEFNKTATMEDYYLIHRFLKKIRQDFGDKIKFTTHPASEADYSYVSHKFGPEGLIDATVSIKRGREGSFEPLHEVGHILGNIDDVKDSRHLTGERNILKELGVKADRITSDATLNDKPFNPNGFLNWYKVKDENGKDKWEPGIRNILDDHQAYYTKDVIDNEKRATDIGIKYLRLLGASEDQIARCKKLAGLWLNSYKESAHFDKADKVYNINFNTEITPKRLRLMEKRENNMILDMANNQKKSFDEIENSIVAFREKYGRLGGYSTKKFYDLTAADKMKEIKKTFEIPKSDLDW